MPSFAARDAVRTIGSKGKSNQRADLKAPWGKLPSRKEASDFCPIDPRFVDLI